jgi:hypothetical protein
MVEQTSFYYRKVLRASTQVCLHTQQDIATVVWRIRADAAPALDTDVIGIIHAISIDDDPMVRQMISTICAKPSPTSA